VNEQILHFQMITPVPMNRDESAPRVFKPAFEGDHVNPNLGTYHKVPRQTTVRSGALG
jgi:hypothetical protein